MITPAPPVDHDEFAGLADVAREQGLDPTGLPPVRRVGFDAGGAGMLSALVWGEGAPELVFLHGGGQNAHTWDAVALLLGRPALAIDLPGHGHSAWRADRDYMPWTNAETLAPMIAALAPHVRAVIGMSLGGATTIRLAAERPDLVRKAVIVDVTPQVNDPGRQLTTEQKGTVALVDGPPSYDSFEAMAIAAIALSPRRHPDAVRRGVRHNAREAEDGRWMWRYDLFGPRPGTDFTPLWDDVPRIPNPAMLVVGAISSHVRPEDVEAMKARLPGLRVETVEGAGHAVQSDQPKALAALIEDFVFGG
jgi:pimeloyl-ACP methyl ester carboxylesterase